MTIPLDANRSYVPVVNLGTTQKLTVSGTSAQSTAIGTTIIRVISTTNCHIAIGTNPTATTSDTYLAANQAEYFAISAAPKLAVIQDSAGGSLYITECTL